MTKAPAGSSSPRVAVVTGAASGIGEDIARHLAGAGWMVFALDNAFADTATGNSDNIQRIGCDVSSADEVAGAFASVAAAAPAIDALVTSAGILRVGEIAATTERDFDAVMAINLRGAWLSARAAVPLLEAAKERVETPRIVFVTSASAARPKVGSGVYAASKAALTTLGRVLAVELAPRGILVNMVAPGTVDTAFIGKAIRGPKGGYRPSGKSPLGRIATPADVTAAVDFLLGPASAYITGTTLPVDGGDTAAYAPASDRGEES